VPEAPEIFSKILQRKLCNPKTDFCVREASKEWVFAFEDKAKVSVAGGYYLHFLNGLGIFTQRGGADESN